MNEFGSEFDGAVTAWIKVSEHATADAVTRLNDLHGNSGAAQLAGRGQSCHAGADHDYCRV